MAESTVAFVEPTRRFAVNGIELAWDRWGQANGRPPLLLCHGFSGSAHDFSLQIPRLSADREVLALDHRGHGRSTHTGDVASYQMDRIAADMIALLDAEAGGPVDVLGHSMGGQIALRTALARPDLVRSLILMDTSANTFRPVDPAMSEALVAFIGRFDPERGLPGSFGGSPLEDTLIEAHTSAEWRERKEQLSAGFDPYALKGLGQELFDDGVADLRGRLPEITVPTTVICGTLDSPLIEQAPSLATALPNGWLTLIEGAYHSPQLTHPDEWAAAVVEHLKWAAD